MARKHNISIGTKWNKWTIIEDLGHKSLPHGRKRPYLKVQCECGTVTELFASQLTTGASKQCRRCSNIVKETYHVGDKFDQLTITGFTEDKKRLAICQCSCGQTLNVRPTILKNSQTNNCGCQPNGKWKGIKEISGTYLYRIKRAAKIRNIPFLVADEYLWDLYIKQEGRCALTKLPISFSRNTNFRQNASLDRIDSSKSYEEGNLQWILGAINRMKMDLSQEDFVNYCKLVASNR